jgi:F0F1-type ATP synthase assembly protein I
MNKEPSNQPAAQPSEQPSGKDTEAAKQLRESLRVSAEAANIYGRYSAMAFQVVGLVAVGAGAGYWLDRHFAHRIPYLTLIFSVVAIIGALTLLIRTAYKINP